MHNTKRTISLLLVLCMLLSVLPVGAQAVTITEKPADGTTVGQPFAPGTGGSQNFRIPGIVTLDNGNLIAVCDARWNHSADSSGLDTIVSVSEDNGANWTYTFANYLGDNGNVFNNLSSCIIDPAIGTDGTTVYLIADLFPAGMAINTSRYRAQRGSTGYDANGNLLLRSDAENGLTFGNEGYDAAAAAATYGYYLKDGAIYTTAGTVVEGYEVDAYFNITGTDGTNTNLFFGDSPYKPFPTDYLYMTTSTDGLNWSEPTLINLKADHEQTLLIGPGNGTYDPTTGRMIFTAYEYDWGTQFACLVWLETDGTWHRSENATVGGHWSSEATSVVLDDGTVRMFYRDGYNNLFYTDYVYSEEAHNYVVSNREVSTTAAKRNNNQLSSIRYSEPVNGKDAIIVTCAANPNARSNGHLYVFLIEEDNSLTLAYDYDIFPGEDEYYAYNCLTEMADGSIALLYESAGSQITYHVIDMSDVLVRENDPNLTVQTVDLLEGERQTFTDNTGCYADPDLSELDAAVATVEVVANQVHTDAAQLGSDTNYSGAAIELSDCLYSFADNGDGTWTITGTDANGNTVYLYPGHTSSPGYPNAVSSTEPLYLYEGYEDGSINIYCAKSDNANGSASYLYFDRAGLRWDRVSTFNNNTTWMTNCSLRVYKAVEGDGSAEIPGYEQVTELTDITEGQYLIAAPGNNGGMYVLYPNTAMTNRYCQIAKVLGRTTVGSTEITFTGVGGGYTEVQIGSTLYQVTVHGITEVPVEVTVGSTVTVTEPNGNFADADLSKLDTTIATVELTGIDGTSANGLSLAPVSELADGTYVIVNTRANKLVTNAPATAAAAAGAGSGLNMAGSTRDEIDPIAVWTITSVNGGYTIQDANGKYMTIGSKTAAITDSANTLSLNYNNGTWTIAQNGAYLNHFGGGSSTCAAGWQDATAAGDAGSQFDLYTYSAEPATASTQVAITGVKAGTTEVLVGYTRYVISVVEAVHEHAFGEWTTVTEATCTTAGEETRSCACGETETREVPALGHDYQVFEIVPPTCYKTGYTVYKCTRCEKSYKDDPIEPEHTWDEGTVTAPTCKDKGFTTYTCLACGYKYVDEASWTDPVDHNHVNGKCTYCGDQKAAPFKDVPAGEFYFDAVEWAVAEGITTGAYDEYYDPNGSLLRAQVVTMLWRHAGEPAPATTENPFQDVTEADFFYNAVLWAYEKGITTGISDDQFGPYGTTNRAQVVTFLWRYLEKPDSTAANSFSDVVAGEWYEAPINWAVENGITNGMGDGTFGITVNCNRAHIVTFMYRALAE